MPLINFFQNACFGGIFLCIAPFTALLGQDSTEQAQIKAIIYAETGAFVDHSFADVAQQYWVMDSCTVLNVTGLDGLFSQVDAEEINNRTEVPPPEGGFSVEKTNFAFHINGNFAVVTCEQKASFGNGAFVMRSKELRIMQKIEGQWRIHQLSVHHYPIK
jgi:hypothetical protein